MNKKGNIYNLMTMIFTVSILSVIAITVFILHFGVMNDYVFYNLQNTSDSLASEGVISEITANETKNIAIAYQDTIFKGDNIWFMIYILFIVMSLISAYELRDYSEVSFFMILFYGLIIFLFVGGLLEIFTNWFVDEIITQLIPNALSYFPKFEWYINNLGVISVVHAVTLLLISRFNFNFAIKKNVNDQEIQAVSETDEVF